MLLPKLGRKKACQSQKEFRIADNDSISNLIWTNEDLRNLPIPETVELDLVSLRKLVRLYQIFSRINHKQTDMSDFELTFDNVCYHFLTEESNKYFEIGDIKRVLMKRFIKTIRGSSYEVDLRLHESISLLENIKNQLLQEIYTTMSSICFSELDFQWSGNHLNIMIIEALAISNRSDYEGLCFDHSFLEICKSKKKSLETTTLSNELLNIVRDKTQLKYIDYKTLEAQIHKLEGGGHLRPNMNNQQGFIGLRFFPSTCFFKLYSLEDCMRKNSSYLSKDAEDRLQFLGVGFNWFSPLCIRLQKNLEMISKSVNLATKFSLVFIQGSLPLKERIVMRLIMHSPDADILRRSKFFKQLKYVARKVKAFENLIKISQKKIFKEFQMLTASKARTENFEKAKVLFSKLNSAFLIKERKEIIHKLRSQGSSLSTITRIGSKFYYLRKLSLRAETFLLIRRWEQRKSKLLRSIKIGDNILKGVFNSHSENQKLEVFNIIQKVKKLRILSEIIKNLYEKAEKGRLVNAIELLKNEMVEKKCQDQLKSHSLIHLRKNYLLNNVNFIIKYRQSLMEQLHLRSAFNQIKIKANNRKSGDERLKRFVSILDSAMKKGLIRMTQNSLKTRWSQVASQNFKVGFHFLELYILRKTLSTSFNAILVKANEEKQGLDKKILASSFHFTSTVGKVFRIMRAMTLLRKRLSSLVNVWTSKESVLRRYHGQSLLAGLKAITTLYKIKLHQRVQMADLVLGRFLKKRFWTLMKNKRKPFQNTLRVPIIKLELILLKARKQAYISGFFSIHKKMVKQIHSNSLAIQSKKISAVTKIQATFRMCHVRAWFLNTKRAALLIQKKIRKYQTKRRENHCLVHTRLAKQRQRLTVMRETAMLRLKEHLSSEKHNQVLHSTPLKLLPEESKLEKDDVQVVKKRTLCSNMMQTANKLQQINQRRHAFGKENDLGFLQVRQPVSMMKLNIDSNARENIKRYKDKVLSNHMIHKGKENIPTDSLVLSESYQTSKLKQNRPLQTAISNNSNENLQDLIQGVKSKIQQIRLTQKSKKENLPIN
jgi:hypothetical protein